MKYDLLEEKSDTEKMNALIIGNDPMEEYYRKGFSKTERERYFGGSGVYDEIYYVSHNPKLPVFIKEFMLYQKCKRIIKKNNINICRAYNSFRAGFIGSLLKKKFNIPLIISIHDEYSVLWGILKLNPFVKRLLLWTERKAFDACDECFCVSTHLYNYARRNGARNATVVFNKLYLPQYQEHTFTVLTIGRMTMRKNQQVIIEAVNQLRQEGHNLRLLIVGQGPLENELKKQMHPDDGLIKSIPNSFLPNMYKSCDVFVMASLTEGFCQVLSEAQCCGVPIISSKLPGSADIINESNALFFDAMDLNMLKEHIKTIMNNKSLREQLVQEGLKNTKKFDSNVIEEQERKIIEHFKK